MNKTHQQLLRMLKDIHRLFEQFEIQYMMCGGTLLGAIRHNGFIPWDLDVDLSVFLQDHLIVRRVLFEPWFQKNYKVVTALGGYRIAVRNLIRYPCADIFFIEQQPPSQAYAFCGPIDKQGNPEFAVAKVFPKQKHPASDIFPLQLYPFEDTQLYGPCKAVDILKRSYSDDCLTRHVVYKSGPLHYIGYHTTPLPLLAYKCSKLLNKEDAFGKFWSYVFSH